MCTIWLFSCKHAETPTPKSNQILNYTVIKTYPHDTLSYTQGLEFINNSVLKESSGIRGLSWLYEVDLNTNSKTKKVNSDVSDFSEGLTILGNKLYLLTLDSNKIYQYNAQTHQLLKTIKHNYAGWGLCNNGSELIYSDGSNTLTYIDTLNFNKIKVIEVTEKNSPVYAINELEYINGFIFANIYSTNRIIIIDPVSGEVVHSVDFSELQKNAKEKYAKINYLNGIAFNKKSKELIITGKFWPEYYSIKLDNIAQSNYLY